MNYINKLNKTYKLFKGINLFRYRFILKKEKRKTISQASQRLGE